MRLLAILIAAFVSILAANSVHAASRFEFQFLANAVGEQTVYDPHAMFCGSHPLGCLASAPFERTFGAQVTLFGETGTGRFEYGSFCANCTGWSGEIIGGFVDGVQNFSGVNFIYTSGNPTVLGSARATAPNFYVRLLSIDGVLVRGPVPEPSTWLMLIVGFGLTCGMLRHRSTAMFAFEHTSRSSRSRDYDRGCQHRPSAIS